MIFETTTDKWGPDVQRYTADSMDEAVEQLRADVRATFDDDAAAEVDESMLLALDAVEVRRDDSGVYRIVGEPDSWETVREYVYVEASAPLTGWDGYTRVYTVTDEHGETRRYFVAE